MGARGVGGVDAVTTERAVSCATCHRKVRRGADGTRGEARLGLCPGGGSLVELRDRCLGWSCWGDPQVGGHFEK